MAIKGSLNEASLPDVLQLLALGRKTGCLSLTDRSNLGYVYFDKGRISYASIVNRRDRLGDILLSSGKITKEQLDEAVARQSSERDKKLGELLVELSAITRSELESYMRLQVEEAIFYLFTWTRGSFQFEVDVHPPRDDFLLSINPQSLLLEGARRIDEWELFEKKVPTFDLVFTLDRDRLESSDVELTDVQKALSGLIDGRRDVSVLIEMSGFSEFEVTRALYGFITAGFAHRSSKTSESVRSTVAADAKIDEHRNLGIAFYKTGMYDESAREFRRVIDLDSNEGRAFFYVGLVGVQQRDWQAASEAFRRVRELGPERPSVLFNLAFSLEHLGEDDEAQTLYAEAAQSAPNNPHILTGWGASALRRRELEAAANRLDKARTAVGDGRCSEVWYWARSLAHAASGQADEAIALLDDGLFEYPRSAVLRNHHAVLLELSGKLELAEKELREAIGNGLWLPQLAKNLGDVLYRTARYDDAWDAYERAVQLDPDLGDDIYFKMGNIAYKRADHERAASMWENTLQRNPSHRLAQTNLDTMNALRG